MLRLTHGASTPFPWIKGWRLTGLYHALFNLSCIGILFFAIVITFHCFTFTNISHAWCNPIFIIKRCPIKWAISHEFFIAALRIWMDFAFTTKLVKCRKTSTAVRFHGTNSAISNALLFRRYSIRFNSLQSKPIPCGPNSIKIYKHFGWTSVSGWIVFRQSAEMPKGY